MQTFIIDHTDKKKLKTKKKKTELFPIHPKDPSELGLFSPFMG